MSYQNLSQLLYSAPAEFLENNQAVIECIVLKFVGSGLFKEDEKDDVIQYINERLLSGVLEKMQEQYNSSFYLKTYFSKIVCNLCLQYSKTLIKRKDAEKNVDFSQIQIPTGETISKNIVYQEIYEHLHTVLPLYGKRRPRLELLFKISLKIGITKWDVLRCYPDCSRELRGIGTHIGEFAVFRHPKKMWISRWLLFTSLTMNHRT